MDVSQEKNRRILIVDDNASIHEDFRKIMAVTANDSAMTQAAGSLFGDVPSSSSSCSSHTYEVDSAFQGQEALVRVEQSLQAGRPYALAFVDVRMPPGWDGVETILRIWQVDPDLQVVICTAYCDYSWSEMIEALGETSHLLILKKPFDNIEVRQLAMALSEKWQLARDVRQAMEQLQRLVEEQSSHLQHFRLQAQAESAARDCLERTLCEEHKRAAVQSSPAK